MTVDNCIMLLEKYKKQMENPVNDTGQPYTGAQRKHAVARSKRNYEAMKRRILSSPKFTGGIVKVLSDDKGQKREVKFERHPIVDELMDKPKPTPKPTAKSKKKEVKEDGNN